MPTSPSPSRICSPLSEPHQTARTPPNSATSSTFGDHSYLTPPARTGGAAANTTTSTPTTASCSPVPLERRFVVAATAPSTTSTSKTCPPQMAPPPFRPPGPAPGLEKNMMVGTPPPGLLPSGRVHAEEESGGVHQAEEDVVLQLQHEQHQKDEHRPPLPPPAEKNCQLSDIPAICARLGIKADDSLLLKFNNKGTNFLKTRKFDPTRPMTKDYLKFLLKTYVKEHSDALKDEMTRLDLIQHFLGAIDATEWRQFLDSGNWRSSTREHQDEQPDAVEDGRHLQGGSAAVAGGGSTSFSQPTTPTTPTGSEASVPILSVGGNPRVVSPLAAGEQTTDPSSPTGVLKAGGSFQFHGPANSTEHPHKRVSFLVDHSDPSLLGGNDGAPAAQQQAVAANAKSPPPRPALLAAATTTSGPALRSSPPNKLGPQELSPAARTAKGSAAPHPGSSTTHRQAAAARQQALNLHASALVRAHGAAAHHQSALYVGTPQTPYGTPSHQQLHQADPMMTGHHLANFAAQAQAQHHAAMAAQAQHQAAALSMAAAASHNQRGYNHLPGGAASVMAAAMAAQSQQHHGAPAGFHPAGVGAGGGYGGAALMGGYGGGSGGYNPYDVAGHHPGGAAGGYHHDLSTTVAGYPNVQATAGGWSQRYPGRGGSRRRGGRHSRGSGLNKHANTADATLTAAGLAAGTGPPRTE